MRLQLLGETTLNTAPISGQTRFILAWLALNSQSTATRAKLARELWMDEDESQGRRRLTKALYRIKQEFPVLEDHLEADNNIIALKDVTVDALEFQTLLKSQNPTDWQTAFELYQGDLLEGEDAPWLEPWREHLREMYFTGLQRALGDAEQKQNISQAILVAQRLVRYNPLSEEAHTRLIRLYATANRREDAVHQYTLLEQTLHNDLGSTPNPELRTYIQTLKHSLEPDKKRYHTLIGRNKELRILAQQLEAAQAGHGSIIALQGEPGMGKTRLLDELEQLSRWHKIPMLRGTAKEQQSNAYAPLEQALQSQPILLEVATPLMRETLKPLLTEEANATASNSSSSAVGAALERWLGKLERPVVIVLDDLQWAGDLFWALLPVLTRITRQKAVLLVLSYRTYEIQTEPFAIEALSFMRQDNAVLSLEVKALTQDECAALAKAISKPLDLQELERLYRLSNGNPLVFLEFLSGEDNAERLDSLVQHRLTHLSKQARTALEAASVLGNNFSLEVWTAMLEGDVPLGELLEARFLTRAGENLNFQHDLIRSSIYQNLLEPEKQKWHKNALEQLNSLGERFAILAYHAEKACLNKVAVEFYRKASFESLHLGALQKAQKYMMQATNLLNYEDQVEKIRLKLLELRLRILIQYSDELLNEFYAFETSVQDSQDVNMLFEYFNVKLRILQNKADKIAYQETADKFISISHQSQNHDFEIDALATVSEAMALNFLDVQTALPMAEQAMRLCEQVGAKPFQQFMARKALLTCLLRLRKTTQAQEILHQIFVLWKDHEELAFLEPQYRFFPPVLALLEDRFEDAIELIKEQIESYRVVANDQGIDRALNNLILVLNILGQYEESVVWAEELAERNLIQKATNSINQKAFALANTVGIQAFLGLTDLAEKTYQPVIDWLLEGGEGFGAIYGWETLGQLRREQQRYQEAFEAFENVRQARTTAGSNPFFYLYSAETAYLAGHHSQAQELLEQISPSIPPERQDYTASVYYYIKYLIEAQATYLEQARFMVLLQAAKLNNPKYRNDVVHNVVYNKDIHKYWQQQDLTTVIAELSRPDGIGTRQVTWTIDSGASDQAHLEQSGKVALRHHRLKRLSLEAAVQNAIPTQEDFAQALGVTLRTIENDLATLRASGMEIRTLGMQKELVKK